MKKVFPYLIEDIKARNLKGWQTYKKELTTNDGRDALQDLYEELLDACAYLKKLILEREEERK